MCITRHISSSVFNAKHSLAIFINMLLLTKPMLLLYISHDIKNAMRRQQTISSRRADGFVLIVLGIIK